jgi:hypothetical protein
MAYTKLFNSIITSTIWSEDDKTRIVWITMLAIADKNGEVQGSIPGLARIAGVDLDDCRAAIRKFLSPDSDSRTKDDEGRRIEDIDGGWSLLNHQKYREMASKDELREAESKRKARYRARQKRNVMSQDVPDMSLDVPKSQHIADADADPLTNNNNAREGMPCIDGYPTKAQAIAAAGNQMIPEHVAASWWLARDGQGWQGKNGHPMPPEAWQSNLKGYSEIWKTNEAKDKAKPRRGTIEANNPEPVNYGTPGFTPARYP